MSLIRFLLSKRSLLGIILRFALFYTPFVNWVSKLPSTSSQFYSYDKLKEIFFFFENGQNPYQISHAFQKPLTASFFYQLRVSDIATLCVFIVIDLLIGYLLENSIFMKRNIQEDKEDESEKTWCSAIYLLNPFTIYSCLTFSTQSLDYLLVLASVYLTFKKNAVIGSVLMGITLYQNPRMILILPVLFLTSKTDDRKPGPIESIDFKPVVQIVIVSGAVFGGLCYLSFMLTQSWDFLETCYYRLFFLNYFEPNLSLAWHMFTEIFNKYINFYFGTLALFQVFCILPLFLLFKKFLRAKNIQVGYLGLLTGFCLGMIVLVGPTSTLYEYGVIVILLCTQLQIINRIKFIFIFTHGAMFALCTSLYMIYSWKNSMTAETSWIFLQTAIFFGGFVATLAEILTTLKHEIIESKPVVEKIDPNAPETKKEK